jgi:hypothetical protein
MKSIGERPTSRPGRSSPGQGISIHYLQVDPILFEAIRDGRIRSFTLWETRNAEPGDWLRICTKRKGINCQMTAYITEINRGPLAHHACSGEFSFEPDDRR